MTAAPARRVPATVLASQMIARALSNATRPNVQEIADATALTVAEVTDLVQQQVNARKATPKPPAQARDVDVIDANLKHADVGVRRAAQHAHTARIAASKAVNELHDALARAQTYAERAARVAQLRAQIAQIEGRVPCPECGALILAHRMGSHHTRMHMHKAGG